MIPPGPLRGAGIFSLLPKKHAARYTCAMPKGKKRKPARLTAAQIKIVGQFNDHSFENPKLTFEQVSLKELGKKLFGKSLSAKEFEKECRKVFDREREA
jgi:hypothetical protein